MTRGVCNADAIACNRDSGTFARSHATKQFGCSGIETQGRVPWCPSRSTAPEFLSSATRDGAVEFDFVVPSVSRWSIGVVYHVGGGADSDSATMTFRDGSGPLKVGHWTRTNRINVHLPDPVSVDSDRIAALPGDVVSFRFETDEHGTTLTLDGVQALAVPRRDLSPFTGPMLMCAGLWSNKPVDYLIGYERLRAWTE